MAEFSRLVKLALAGIRPGEERVVVDENGVSVVGAGHVPYVIPLHYLPGGGSSSSSAEVRGILTSGAASTEVPLKLRAIDQAELDAAVARRIIVDARSAGLRDAVLALHHRPRPAKILVFPKLRPGGSTTDAYARELGLFAEAQVGARSVTLEEHSLALTSWHANYCRLALTETSAVVPSRP